ncbi:hypothetical protein [Yoonia sp. 2307UL14-13]|uniref:hypothetical protein n=1 Tax=Yoonia sp. 2307UL14-13 TaxID=3126506 RepID=UPI0030B0CDD1
MNQICVPLSPVDAIERLAILTLRYDSAIVATERARLRGELTTLGRAIDRILPDSADPKKAFYEVHADLWSLQDDLRACVARGDFGPAFLALAQSHIAVLDQAEALRRTLADELDKGGSIQ